MYISSFAYARSMKLASFPRAYIFEFTAWNVHGLPAKSAGWCTTTKIRERIGGEENGGNGSTGVFCMTSSRVCPPARFETTGEIFRRRYSHEKFSQPRRQNRFDFFLLLSKRSFLVSILLLAIIASLFGFLFCSFI